MEVLYFFVTEKYIKVFDVYDENTEILTFEGEEYFSLQDNTDVKDLYASICEYYNIDSFDDIDINICLIYCNVSKNHLDDIIYYSQNKNSTMFVRIEDLLCDFVAKNIVLDVSRGAECSFLSNFYRAYRDEFGAVKCSRKFEHGNIDICISENDILNTIVLGNLLENDSVKQIAKIISLTDKIKHGDGSSYFLRANCYYYLSCYEEAVTDYTKAIEWNPRDAVAYNNRGIAYKNQGMYEEAISDYTKGIELNPKDAVIYFDRGYSYDEEGMYE